MILGCGDRPRARPPRPPRTDAGRLDAARRSGSSTSCATSIDRTLALIKDGQAEQAFTRRRPATSATSSTSRSRCGSSTPAHLRRRDEVRRDPRADQRRTRPTGEIRSNIVELRGLIDDAERQLTDNGLGAPAVVFGQSFLIIFREGLEAVLLVSVLLGYLEAAKATQYRRPILFGMGVGRARHGRDVLRAAHRVLDALPVGREVLEAITALARGRGAVLRVVLADRAARAEALARVPAGPGVDRRVGRLDAALVLVGFTAVYREGFETALFYQALLSFGPGLGVVGRAGLVAGIVALAVVAWLIFRLGRRVPLKAFLSTAVVLLMVTSVAFLGNAVRSLQEADVIALHRWPGWPRAADLPVAVARLLAEPRDASPRSSSLITVYVLGALYMFVLRPQMQRSVGNPRRRRRPTPSARRRRRAVGAGRLASLSR